MYLHEIGAARRLEVGFLKAKPKAKAQHCASPLLTNHELRRLVADMVD